MLARLVAACALVLCYSAQLQSFLDHHIVPDVIPNAPDILLTVTYVQAGIQVQEGNELLLAQVQLAPEVTWTADPNHPRDDPDGSSPDVRHWLVTNIPGSAVASGQAVTTYAPSNPPAGHTALNRYIFLLYRQPNGAIVVTEPWANDPTGSRGSWSLQDFVTDYALQGPLAGNFYLATYQPRPDASKSSVEYPSGVSVSEGNELTPTQVKDIPQVTWDEQPDTFYTLCMIDLDAPSREAPSSRAALHWLAGNVRGADVAGGEPLAAYVGSGPRLGSGLHRYVFLVYRQRGRIDFDLPHLTDTRWDEHRRNFSIGDFAAEHYLGEPQFGNFYQAQFDEYVPILHAYLGIA